MPESWALATAPWGFMLSASLPWVLLVDELDACHVFGGLNSSHSRRTRGLTRCHWLTMQPSRYRRAGPAFDRDKLISLVRMALSSFAFSDEQTIARIAHSDDRPPVHDLIYHRLAPDLHM